MKITKSAIKIARDNEKKVQAVGYTKDPINGKEIYISAWNDDDKGYIRMAFTFEEMKYIMRSAAKYINENE